MRTHQSEKIPSGLWTWLAKQVEQSTLGTTLFIFVAMELLSGLVIWDFGEFWVNSVADTADFEFHQTFPLTDKGGVQVTTLLIGDKAYEDDFSQTSPLNRVTLGKLIRDISEKSPHAALLVDLDLSPREAIPPEQQKFLDEVLRSLGHRLVLITPDKAMTPAAAWPKVEWIQKLCGAGVQFGSPAILTRYGTVDPEFSTQGTLAGMAAAPVNRESIPATPCDLSAKMAPTISPLFWDASGYAQEEDRNEGRKIQLRSEYFSSGNALTLNSVKDVENMHALARADYIVLGGGWGADDVFVTIAGDRYGAEVHAARLYSVENPVRGPIFPINAILGVLVVGVVAQLMIKPPLRKHFEYFGKYQTTRQCATGNVCGFSESGKGFSLASLESGQNFLLASSWLAVFLLAVLSCLLLLLAINTIVVHLLNYDIGVANMVFALVIGLFISTPRIYRSVSGGAGQTSQGTEQKGEHKKNSSHKAIVDRFRYALQVNLATIKHGAEQIRHGSIRSGLANFTGGILSLAFYFIYTFWLMLRDLFSLFWDHLSSNGGWL